MQKFIEILDQVAIPFFVGVALAFFGGMMMAWVVKTYRQFINKPKL